jgi:hypothetical protein
MCHLLEKMRLRCTLKEVLRGSFFVFVLAIVYWKTKRDVMIVTEVTKRGVTGFQGLHSSCAAG